MANTLAIRPAPVVAPARRRMAGADSVPDTGEAARMLTTIERPAHLAGHALWCTRVAHGNEKCNCSPRREHVSLKWEPAEIYHTGGLLAVMTFYLNRALAIRAKKGGARAADLPREASLETAVTILRAAAQLAADDCK